jgi:metallo-beta-lactamase class B
MDDADVNAYASTIEHVLRKCSHPKYIITGHDDYTNLRSLNHTLAMAKALEKKNAR